MKGSNMAAPEEDPLDVVAELHVRLHRNGALSVAGPIGNKDWCLAALENAKDAVRNHHGRKLETPGGILVPANDVEVPDTAIALKVTT
jgi:hypothetical protein